MERDIIPDTDKNKSLEFQRLIDGQSYRFERKGDRTYKRTDMDLWLIYKEDFGWGVYNRDGSACYSTPWNTPISLQCSDHPPLGMWVSRKGAKSYVYQLAEI